jgi:hypothetical protein
MSGSRLHASWVNLPHVTQFDEADITDMEAARVKLKERATAQGVKLTPLSFVLRAVVRTLLQFPQFNASLDASGENLVYKKYLHLGFAADTPNGLMVPVIRDADKKDVYELARALGAVSAKARGGKLRAAERKGGGFPVSSLGGIGAAFTPIINAPSCHPGCQIIDETQVPRRRIRGAPVAAASLSYDHRVIDGADGARFCAALAATLADVPGLLEAVPWPGGDACPDIGVHGCPGHRCAGEAGRSDCAGCAAGDARDGQGDGCAGHGGRARRRSAGRAGTRSRRERNWCADARKSGGAAGGETAVQSRSDPGAGECADCGVEC